MTSQNNIPAIKNTPAWLSGLEIFSVACLLLAMLWQVWRWIPIPYAKPVLRILLPGLIGGIVIMSFIRLRENLHSLGLSRACMRQGWGSVLIFSCLGFVALLIGGKVMGLGSIKTASFIWAGKYTAGLVGQQIALQAFVNNRIYAMCAGMTDKPRLLITVVIGTIVFTILHLPNLWLMVLVLPASAFWIWHFRIFHNLPALLLSHLILGVMAMIMLGQGPLLNLRVGLPALKKMGLY